MQFDQLKRREVIALLGGAAAWPLAARAQQPALPVVAFINGGTAEAAVRFATAFRNGLSERGYVEGQNVTVEYHWLAGRYDGLPALLDNLVRRGVAVIATPGSNLITLAAKTATSTIPIVFGVDDPVKLGLVASLPRPGGNATGINFFAHEVVSKQIELLHKLVPRTARIALLVNPANVTATELTVNDARDAARALGLEIQVMQASTAEDIDTAFASIKRERTDAVYIAGDGFFASRRVQLATLAARERVPASCVSRDMVEAGLLMSYGTNIQEMFRQVGSYAGTILRGTKPADLPVFQSTKFEFIINLQTAKSLGLSVPPTLLAIADEVIE
jgi:putative ABC transport system substrate-binding protein